MHLVSIVSHTLPNHSPRTARVIAENANLRETPSTSGLAGGEVPEGTLVKVLDEKLSWYVVRVGDRVGWMPGATLLFIENGNMTTSDQEPAMPPVGLLLSIP
jgi:uncharacterized protein YgiM (DUF1202 family)